MIHRDLCPPKSNRTMINLITINYLPLRILIIATEHWSVQTQVKIKEKKRKIIRKMPLLRICMRINYQGGETHLILHRHLISGDKDASKCWKKLKQSKLYKSRYQNRQPQEHEIVLVQYMNYLMCDVQVQQRINFLSHKKAFRLATKRGAKIKYWNRYTRFFLT